MLKRILRENGPALSEIGLGTWAIGGQWSGGWGPQDDNDSIATIRRAMELGINWLDTAPIYGFGHSEKVVGEALKGRRENMFIASKCGLPWSNKHKIRHDNSPESILLEIDQSLLRLRTDYIDLYQIHWPDSNVAVEKSWETLLQLKEKQKVKYIGVSNFNVAQLSACQKLGPVDSLQPPYNLLSRDIEKEILPWCRQHGLGVLAYSPLASGILSGKFDPAKLAKGDWRNYNDFFREDQLQNHRAIIEKLLPLAKKYGKTMAQFAIAWVLNQPGITAAIVGARRPAQIEENFWGAGWKIDVADLAEIREISIQ